MIGDSLASSSLVTHHIHTSKISCGLLLNPSIRIQTDVRCKFVQYISSTRNTATTLLH